MHDTLSAHARVPPVQPLHLIPPGTPRCTALVVIAVFFGALGTRSGARGRPHLRPLWQLVPADLLDGPGLTRHRRRRPPAIDHAARNTRRAGGLGAVALVYL